MGITSNTITNGARSNSSLVPVLAAPSIRLLGDSICSQNSAAAKPASGGSSMALTSYAYFWNLLNWAIGNTLKSDVMLNISNGQRYGVNSGIGGLDMDELFTVTPNLPTILSTMPETHLLIMIGTNDANDNAMTLATLNSRFDTVTSTIIAAGKIPIWTTILPRNAVDGANDWNNTTTTTANRRKMVAAHNLYRRARCKQLGIICSDLHAAVMSATGQATTGYTTDGLHPDGPGAFAMFTQLYSDIGHLLPTMAGKRDIYDAYDATYNPYGNILNGALTGTGGATSVGSGTGTITGTIPDNFQLAKSTSTTTSVVAAVVARTDGLPGNVLELTFTSLGTGAAAENWRLNYWSGATTSLASFGITDDYMVMEAEIETLGAHGGCGLATMCRIGDSSSITTGALTTLSVDSATATITASSGTPFSTFLAGRLLTTSGFSNAANRGVWKILSVNGGGTSITVGSSYISSIANLVTEAAGTSATCLIPTNSVVTGGASTTKCPQVNTPVLYHRTPIYTCTKTGNIVPRLDIYVNGTIVGTHVVRIANPSLKKLQTLPTVCTFLADDY